MSGLGLKDKFKKAGKGLEKIVAKGAGVVVKPFTGTYGWMKEYKHDIENGFFIGADGINFLRYLSPVDTMKGVIQGTPPAKGEQNNYSIGVERAELYSDRHDQMSQHEQGKVAAATWWIGVPVGAIASPILYPLWIRRINKRKAKKEQGLQTKGLEQHVIEK